MLILTRKVDETIVIDDKIEVKVIELEGNKVKIGIEAPDDISIYRQEVLEEIQRENQAALEQQLIFKDNYAGQLKKFFEGEHEERPEKG